MAKTYKTVRDMVHDIGDPEFVEFYDAMNDVKNSERDRCISVMRKYLQFQNQRAVSWHEVEDCIVAINRGDDFRNE